MNKTSDRNSGHWCVLVRYTLTSVFGDLSLSSSGERCLLRREGRLWLGLHHPGSRQQGGGTAKVALIGGPTDDVYIHVGGRGGGGVVLSLIWGRGDVVIHYPSTPVLRGSIAGSFTCATVKPPHHILCVVAVVVTTWKFVPCSHSR